MLKKIEKNLYDKEIEYYYISKDIESFKENSSDKKAELTTHFTNVSSDGDVYRIKSKDRHKS